MAFGLSISADNKWSSLNWCDKDVLLRDQIIKPGFYFQTWGKETFVRYVYAFNGDWFVTTTRSDGAAITHSLSHYQPESLWLEIDMNKVRIAKKEGAA